MVSGNAEGVGFASKGRGRCTSIKGSKQDANNTNRTGRGSKQGSTRARPDRGGPA